MDELCARCSTAIEFYDDAEFCDADFPVFPTPEIPLLPELPANMKIADLSSDILRRIALTLELPGCSHLLHNWQKLAEYLGMSHREIQYLVKCVSFPQSPCVVLLFQNSSVAVNDLLELLICKDKLYRWDVIYDILDQINDMCQENYPANQSSISNYQIFPGLNPSTQSNSVNLEMMNSEDLTSCSELGTSINESNTNSNKCKILISWFPESKEHREYVRWLSSNLQQYGAEVMRDDHFVKQLQSTEIIRYQKFYSQAHTILIVLSRHYKLCCNGELKQVLSHFGNEDPVLLERRVKFIQLLHVHMEMEVYRNMAVLQRFRIVQLSATSKDNIPEILSGNIIFQWPANQTQLFSSIFQPNKNLAIFPPKENSSRPSIKKKSSNLPKKKNDISASQTFDTLSNSSNGSYFMVSN